MYENLDDEALIVRYRQGDEAALDHLLYKYKNMVRTRARAMFLAGGDTDDLIQEGMIGLFKAVRDYEKDRGSSFQNFAKLCVERQMLNAIQLSNRKKHSPLNSSVSLDGDPETEMLSGNRIDNPEELVIDQEDLRSLSEKNYSILSPLEKQVLEMYLEENSYEEIGNRLGKSAKSVDNALRRIRKKLRGNLG